MGTFLSNAYRITVAVLKELRKVCNIDLNRESKLTHYCLEILVDGVISEARAVLGEEEADRLTMEKTAIVPASKIVGRFSEVQNKSERIRGHSIFTVDKSRRYVQLYTHDQKKFHSSMPIRREGKEALGHQTVLGSIGSKFGPFAQKMFTQRHGDVAGDVAGGVTVEMLNVVADFEKNYSCLPKPLRDSVEENQGSFNCRFNAVDLEIIKKKITETLIGRKQADVWVPFSFKESEDSTVNLECQIATCTLSDIKRMHMCILDAESKITYDSQGQEENKTCQKLHQLLCSEKGGNEIETAHKQSQFRIVGAVLTQQLVFLIQSNFLGDDSGFLLKQPKAVELEGNNMVTYNSSSSDQYSVEKKAFGNSYFHIGISDDDCIINLESPIYFSTFSANRGAGPDLRLL